MTVKEHKSWRPSDKVRGMDEAHQYPEYAITVKETFDSDYERKDAEKGFKHPDWLRGRNRQIRAHFVWKSLRVESKIHWICPMCNQGNVHELNEEHYHAAHALEAECVCGATIFMSVKAPLINVYASAQALEDDKKEYEREDNENR